MNARLGEAFSISDKAFAEIPVDTGRVEASTPVPGSGAGSPEAAGGADEAAAGTRAGAARGARAGAARDARAGAAAGIRAERADGATAQGSPRPGPGGRIDEREPLDPGRRIYENLRAMREAGFTHIHFSYKWRSPHPMTSEELRIWERALERTEMGVLDVHGIHSPGVNLWDPDDEGRARALELFRHRLEVTARLGGDAMVYHVPTRVEPAPDLVARYLDGLARMEEVAARLGVYVALENVFLGENDRVVLPACFERFSADYIRFTFDTGHASISGNFSWLVQECIERLHILHLHDNDSLEDRHWLPMDEGGTVDWTLVAEAIARSPYEKPIQLEVRWDRARYGAHSEFLAAAYRACRRITQAVARARGMEGGEENAPGLDSPGARPASTG